MTTNNQEKAFQLITVQQLAKSLNVSKVWLYSASLKGLIPSYKIGGHLRFDLDEVKKWLKEKSNK